MIYILPGFSTRVLKAISFTANRIERYQWKFSPRRYFSNRSQGKHKNEVAAMRSRKKNQAGNPFALPAVAP
jgi:hypothetical protein